MAPPIQADSLSTIMRLADNPPAYVNPTAQVMPSIILYIVRVPGSQDLFLTTLHPLASTVTGEDIRACLYYIHIHPPSNTPQPGHLVVRPTSHRRWSSQSLRSPRWHKPVSALPTMTIVRRDPATGAQWNVAQVSQIPPAQTTPSSSATPDSNDAILLEIMTPGYDKFLPPKRAPYHPPPATSGHVGGPGLSWKDFAYGSPEEERAEWEVRRREQLQAETRRPGVGKVADDERPLDEPEERVFRREMSLEGVGFWSRIRGIGGHRQSKSRDGSSGGGGDGDEKQKKDKVKKRGYVFEALWGANATEGTGKCGFKDEAAGKYLKCKYYPPVVNSTPQQSSLLSVIEFKPPSTTSISSSSRASSPSTDMNAVAPETLLSSKSKLGMLVLHSDGQYMIDLLVAANMAVFWRRWETWTAERLALGVAGR